MNETLAKVAILMATRDGAAFLDDQLQSLVNQHCERIDVLVSDDGSTDATWDVLQGWAERWPKGKLIPRRGPEKGFAENFRTLILNSPTDAEYFAFCDQDDIWEPQKLELAIAWLESGLVDTPKLFCSRTRIITEGGEPIGCSPLFSRPPSFRNALVQSIAGGNTMVFNRAARDLIVLASQECSFVSHDWWAYLLVTGAGGKVHYSPDPLVLYRQHSTNQVGANTSMAARINRTRNLLKGQFYQWTQQNMEGLEKNVGLLIPEAQEACRLFMRAREGSSLQRLRALRHSRVYRQTWLGSLSLHVAVAVKRI